MISDTATMRLFILLTLLLSGHTLSRSKNTFDREIDRLMEVVEVNKFLQAADKIKDYGDVSEIDELDYELKNYFNKLDIWRQFDSSDYKNAFRRNLRLTFREDEVRLISRYFKNPFYQKVIKTMTLYRDVIGFYHNVLLIEAQVPSVMDSRYTLIDNLFKIHGMQVQQDLLKKRLTQTLAGSSLVIPMYGEPNNQKVITTNGLESRNERFHQYFILTMAQDFKGFRHYEIREYIRIMQSKPLFKKFSQLFVNFHFMYMHNYIQKLELGKQRQIKALEVPSGEQQALKVPGTE